MLLIFLLTFFVLLIPMLQLINAQYIRRIALFIGASQIALLAFSGKIDEQLSEVMISSFNHALTFTYAVVLEKISYLLFTI